MVSVSVCSVVSNKAFQLAGKIKLGLIHQPEHASFNFFCRLLGIICVHMTGKVHTLTSVLSRARLALFCFTLRFWCWLLIVLPHHGHSRKCGAEGQRYHRLTELSHCGAIYDFRTFFGSSSSFHPFSKLWPNRSSGVWVS